MKIYSTLDSSNVVLSCNEMGILNMGVKNIIILIITLMKMILILLLLSDFWLGILNLKNVKHLKNDK